MYQSQKAIFTVRANHKRLITTDTITPKHPTVAPATSFMAYLLRISLSSLAFVSGLTGFFTTSFKL